MKHILGSLLVLSSTSLPAHAVQLAPQLQPTGRATVSSGLSPTCVGRTFVAFATAEISQGVDLNGDGDITDGIITIHDLRSGGTRSLGHAMNIGAVPVATDRYLAFAVVEAFDGATDLNGDGDTLDHVVFLFDRATAQLRNLGVAILSNSVPALTDTLLVFAANEAGQNNTDLDGDGAVNDCVYVLDLTTNVGAAIGPRAAPHIPLGPGPFAISSTRIYWRANSDGQVWRSDRATLTTVGLGWKTSSAPITRGGLVAFAVPEGSNGQDLNGDGDTADNVAGVVGSAGGSVVILPAHGVGEPETWLEIGKNLLLGLRYEGGPFGTDVNGDADSSDQVVFVYDDRTGVTTNMFRAGVFAPQFAASIDGDFFAFAISELGQNEDLNGDGDKLDNVAEIRDIHYTAIALVEMAIDTSTSNALQVSRGRLGFLASETAEGRDLNGDGLIDALVPHVMDPQLWFLPPVSLGLGTAPILANSFHYNQNRASFLARESTVDLNGDGDLVDDVFVVRGTTPNSTTNTIVAVSGGGLALRARDGVIAVGASESSSGNTSLNGDADTNDRVMFVLRMNP